MANILIVDNEHRDVDGLINLLRGIESDASSLENRDPGLLEYVSSAGSALSCLYKQQKKGVLFDAIITDFHLGNPDSADIDGDQFLFLLDGKLEEAVFYRNKLIPSNIRSFEGLLELEGVNEEVVEKLRDIYGTLVNYQLFVDVLLDNMPLRIVFSGNYDGGYPQSQIDYVFKKDPQDGYCEKNIADALVSEQIYDELSVNRAVSNGNHDEFFHGEINGYSDLIRNSDEEVDLMIFESARKKGLLDAINNANFF